MSSKVKTGRSKGRCSCGRRLFSNDNLARHAKANGHNVLAWKSKWKSKRE